MNITPEQIFGMTELINSKLTPYNIYIEDIFADPKFCKHFLMFIEIIVNGETKENDHKTPRIFQNNYDINKATNILKSANIIKGDPKYDPKDNNSMIQLYVDLQKNPVFQKLIGKNSDLSFNKTSECLAEKKLIESQSFLISQLQNDIELCKSENENLRNENNFLKSQVEQYYNFKKEFDVIQQENSSLKLLIEEIDNIKEENESINQENQKLKDENKSLQNKVEKLSNDIQGIESNFQQPLIMGLPSVHGIINYLLKNQENSILVLVSSTDSGSKENVLYNDEERWISYDSPRSFISFEFKTKPISLTGYLLRSHDGPSFVRNWIVEGSNDEISWIIIDKQANNNSLSGRFKENIFYCQPNNYFSFFKITQTDYNANANNFFELSYVEFYGEFYNE
jgi:FtsZ-binding cell division protein ZapB